MATASTTSRLDLLTHTVYGVKMASRRWRGPGSPIVCVPGAGISGRELVPLLQALGETHDAWAVDLPGFGQSAARRATPWSGRTRTWCCTTCTTPTRTG
jgi:pimeloyl-ACP methyl ester carboxylesterase